MKTLAFLGFLLATLPAALACSALAEDAPKPEQPKEQPVAEAPPRADPPKADEPKEPVPQSQPKALELFDKAVAWQGKPTQAAAKLMDLEIDQLDFKLWGENEVAGRFKILYTAPDKIWFKVWTQAWWRNYWTNGTATYRKTGTTKGSEFLDPKNKDDSEGIALVAEALRVIRLVVLENHRSPDAIFQYMGMAKPRGRKDVPECHLLKRLCLKRDDQHGPIYFYLSPSDFSPICIGVLSLLTVNGTFLIHLSGFTDFQGVRFPTHVEIFQVKKEEPEKFLFADVVRDAANGIKVEVNGGIDDEIYEYQK